MEYENYTVNIERNVTTYACYTLNFDSNLVFVIDFCYALNVNYFFYSKFNTNMFYYINALFDLDRFNIRKKK